MVRELELANFRRFEVHGVDLRPMTLIVGANNAGKSTIIEALRLVSMVANRYRALQFREPPAWLDEARAARGVAPSLAGTGIDLAAVMHQYGEPPALVKATFRGGETVSVYLGPEGELHAVIRGRDGALVSDRQQAHRVHLPKVATQPQVAPVLRDERLLAPDTVRRNLSSSLAPSHFRNQLYLLRERHFDDLCSIAEATWPGFAIDDLVREGNAATPDPQLRLLVRDGPFVGEIALMGHGLQMWLQTLWFLVRNQDAETIILDEPDVYMHPDLQHRLIRYLKGRHPQVIVASHSAEIMSEVDASDVLIINARQPRSTYANTANGVQAAIDRMGGIHNLQLARLAAAAKCLLVEGKDTVLLKRFQDALFPGSLEPFDTIPRMSIGGWSGWPYAVGSSMFLQNAAGDLVRIYCILDSDFHPPELIAERAQQAAEAGVDLHVWARKEIENYLLVPTLIHRVITERLAARTQGPTSDEVAQKLDEVADGFRPHVTDQFANEYLARDRASGLPTANRRAREYVDPIWTTAEGRLARAPGKAVLGEMSGWSQSEFGVSFGAATLAASIRPDELAAEVIRVVTAIESHGDLA